MSYKKLNIVISEIRSSTPVSGPFREKRRLLSKHTTSLQRRCNVIDVVCLLGNCNISFSDNLHLKSHCLGTNNTFRNVSRMSRECPANVNLALVTGARMLCNSLTFLALSDSRKLNWDGFATPATTLWLIWETICCAFLYEHVQHSSDRRTRGPVGPITVRYRLKETDSWESSSKFWIWESIYLHLYGKLFLSYLRLVITIILGDIFFFQM